MRPTVLIVDDVEANLIALESQLHKLDCDVVRAHSGNTALRAMLKQRFAVVLLDVQMPEMDGYEVAKLARENPSTSEVPIIFVTAMHETEMNALEGYEAGAVDYLFKPINPAILLSKVRVFLELQLGRERLAQEIASHKLTLAELEAFNYSVSHDLRAPLRPMSGFARALLEDYGDRLDDTARDYLERINGAAIRMGQLIEDLLSLSQVVRTDMRVGRMDLAFLARAILEECRAQEPGRQVEVVIPNELPMQGDERLLRIALENLLRNAWKFTRKKEAARIEVGIQREGGKQVFFVRDNGAGFNSEHAAKLFKPFQRLHDTSEFEGTGIGLAIVQRIVHRHGGNIWARSAEGKGATFFFTVFERSAH